MLQQYFCNECIATQETKDNGITLCGSCNEQPPFNSIGSKELGYPVYVSGGDRLCIARLV